MWWYFHSGGKTKCAMGKSFMYGSSKMSDCRPTCQLHQVLGCALLKNQDSGWCKCNRKMPRENRFTDTRHRLEKGHGSKRILNVVMVGFREGWRKWVELVLTNWVTCDLSDKAKMRIIAIFGSYPMILWIYEFHSETAPNRLQAHMQITCKV